MGTNTKRRNTRANSSWKMSHDYSNKNEQGRGETDAIQKPLDSLLSSLLKKSSVPVEYTLTRSSAAHVAVWWYGHRYYVPTNLISIHTWAEERFKSTTRMSSGLWSIAYRSSTGHFSYRSLLICIQLNQCLPDQKFIIIHYIYNSFDGRDSSTNTLHITLLNRL